LNQLPHEILSVNQLENLFENNSKAELQNKYRNKLIITIFDMPELYHNKKGTEFNFKEFSENPSV